MNAQESSFEPIFIVGFPRSGTTLLATILDRHSHIAVPPETQFYHQVAPGIKKTYDHASILNLFFANPRCRDLGLEKDKVCEVFSGYFPSGGNLLRSALEVYCRMRGKKIVGEKSPVHLLYWKDIIIDFPHARFIVIIRDGRDAVLSNVKASFTHNNLRRHCAEWNIYMRNVREIKQDLGERVLLLRYEDCLLDPSGMLNSLSEFLGLHFDDSQLQPSDCETVPEWEKEWKGKALSKIDPSRVEAWRKEATESEIVMMNIIMAKELNRNGYADVTFRSQAPYFGIVEYSKTWLYLPPIFPLARFVKRGMVNIFKFLKISFNRLRSTSSYY